MHTGYFGKMKNYPKDKGYRYVSIARFAKFWHGDEYKKLAPPADIIKIEDIDLYTKLYYEKVLNKLNAKQVLKNWAIMQFCFVMKNGVILKKA